ncbi:hypothetical protein RFI_28856, partial [Reticulomyxa filosa]
SKNQLHQKIAELCCQNEDLETTLVMVRNSWNETGSVMEKQLNMCNSKIEKLTKELRDCEVKYESVQPEFQVQGEIIEKLQRQRHEMDVEMSSLEFKCASQCMEIAQLKTQLSYSQSKCNKMKMWFTTLMEQGNIKPYQHDDDYYNDKSVDIISNLLQSVPMTSIKKKIFTGVTQIDMAQYLLLESNTNESNLASFSIGNSVPLPIDRQSFILSDNAKCEALKSFSAQSVNVSSLNN